MMCSSPIPPRPHYPRAETVHLAVPCHPFTSFCILFLLPSVRFGLVPQAQRLLTAIVRYPVLAAGDIVYRLISLTLKPPIAEVKSNKKHFCGPDRKWFRRYLRYLKERQKHETLGRSATLQNLQPQLQSQA